MSTKGWVKDVQIKAYSPPMPISSQTAVAHGNVIKPVWVRTGIGSVLAISVITRLGANNRIALSLPQ